VSSFLLDLRRIRSNHLTKLDGHEMTVSGTISSILKHKGSQVWAISPESTVFEAIQLMSEKNVGALLVITTGKLLGVISERDYTRNVALKGKSSKETKVREIIASSVISVSPDYTVEHCMRIMTDNRVRHLPVLEGERILGVVSIGDLVNWIISAQNEAISQLENYISGQYPG
jgi:CBS domain-containing protein